MASRTNSWQMKQQVDEMTSSLNSKVTKWHEDETASR